MANRFKGVVELPDDDAYATLKETGSYTDADGTTVTYDPNWIYVTPNTVASTVAKQKLQIEDIYSKLTNTVTVDGIQTITGPKTFRESIYLANTDGTTDRIAHINNNFIIYSGANNGVALLNIDEGLGKISAFNKELAFKEDIQGGSGNTTVYVNDVAVSEVRFVSNPQTQIDDILNNKSVIQANDNYSVLIGTSDINATECVAIGKDVIVTGATVGNIAIGSSAYSHGHYSIAIGGNNVTSAKANGHNLIQLGPGTNTKQSTFQLYDDNIYNFSTHTLTVQNIELNGDDLDAQIVLLQTDKANKDLSNVSFPIGYVYISVDSTSPASLFGGTWEQIGQGRALFGAGTLNDITYTAGSTVDAGLPNISGYFDIKVSSGNSRMMYVDGKLFKQGSGSNEGTYSTSSTKYSTTRANFNASNVNSIYGNSETVQPNAYIVYMWKRVA